MTKIEDKKWLEEYLGVEIVSFETKVQDLLIILARKVERLEKYVDMKMNQE